MGREVRRVPADWKHPLRDNGTYSDGSPHYQPKISRSYAQALAEWEEGKAAWERGEFPAYASEESKLLTYEEWEGEAPDPDYYMPEFPYGSCTHYQMYETCTEGSPISPVMDSPESLARWLADNGASSFGSATSTYEQWLRVCGGGFAPSAFVDETGIHPGVDLS
jgi:hypothetical protein